MSQELEDMMFILELQVSQIWNKCLAIRVSEFSLGLKQIEVVYLI